MTKPSGDNDSPTHGNPDAPQLRSQSVDTVLGKIRVQVSHGAGPAVLMWPSLLMTGDLWGPAKPPVSVRATAWSSSIRPATVEVRPRRVRAAWSGTMREA